MFYNKFIINFEKNCHTYYFRSENPCESAFRGELTVYSWVPTAAQEHDLVPSINPPRVKNLLRDRLVEQGAIKWYLSVNVRFTKMGIDGGEAIAEPFFYKHMSSVAQ